MAERWGRMLVVLLSLVLALVLLLRFWDPEEDLDPEATARVWQVAADDVVHIVAERPDGQLILRKEGKRWFVDAPFQDPADPRQVEYLLGELERVEKGIPVPDADPADFGLAPEPVVEITIELADGAQHTLQVGGKAPVDWRTYVRGADGAVVAVTGIIGERFLMDAEKLRDRSVVQYGIEDVRRVVIDGPGGTLDVHGEGARWWVDGWTRADADAIDDLLVSLRGVRFDSFYEDTAPGGLAEPLFRVDISTVDGDIGFEVGESGPDGRYVRNLTGRAGWIESDKLALLGQGPTDVGDPHAFPLDIDDAVSVQVDLGGSTFSAWQKKELWKAKSMDDAEAAVRALAEVPISYRREPGPALDESWGSVAVTYADGEVRSVDIGQEVDGEFRAAKDRDGGEPYLVRIDALDEASAALWPVADEVVEAPAE